MSLLTGSGAYRRRTPYSRTTLWRSPFISRPIAVVGRTSHGAMPGGRRNPAYGSPTLHKNRCHCKGNCLSLGIRTRTAVDILAPLVPEDKTGNSLRIQNQ